MQRKRIAVPILPGLLLILVGVMNYGTGCDQTSTSGGVTVEEDMSVPDQATGGGCGLVTCATAQASCGLIGDGCGSTIDCGSCAAPTTCGGGGTQFVCGGNSACTPVPQAQACSAQNANCGEVSDGCGSTVNCGACTGTDSCGGAGIAFKCGTGGPTSCVPLTCAMIGSNCGTAGDGCGGTLSCGTCMAGMSCGANGVAGVCGSNTCTPRTCAMQGATCGVVGDGCGGVTANCGSCMSPTICGGAGVANVCGSPACTTDLCKAQKTCVPATTTTTLTGKVTAPGHDDTTKWGVSDPVPSALVYIPNAAVAPITDGVSCDQCGDAVSGSPLVSATTGVDGTFTLTNVPCGVSMPLVVQLGRWRRQVTIPAVACCTNTALTIAQTRLPRTRAEGNIPKIAVVTGSADPMECVLPKIGIDPSEFTQPSSAGRVNFYQSSGSTTGAGATLTGTTPLDTALFGSLTTMKMYDLIIIDCEGAAYDKSPYYNNILSYTAAGGRIYTSHFGYSFIHGKNQAAPPALNTAWDTTATWKMGQATPSDQAATIDQSFPKGMTFAAWLKLVAGGTAGKVQVNNVRHDFNAVIAPAQRWIYGTVDGTATGAYLPMHYTFNTPVGVTSDKQCGRVMYSDFHVNTGAAGTGQFPAECNLGTGKVLTAQEKVLEFMLFDLTSCLKADVPMCTPKTCAQQNYTCGQQGDGCGALIAGGCGTCPAGQSCGGSGVPGTCGNSCTPTTCAKLSYTCGTQGDGCGNGINCGTCTAPQFCGGGGPGKCGSTTCTPATCTGLGVNCGTTGDGCGNTIMCGTCPTGQTCGANGMPGKCGSSCTPRTCASAGANCGALGDGCGATLNCGTCPTGQSCGGLGQPNVCGTLG